MLYLISSHLDYVDLRHGEFYVLYPAVRVLAIIYSIYSCSNNADFTILIQLFEFRRLYD